MIKFEKIHDGFNVFFKEYLLLRHTTKKPCIAIGSGTSVIKNRHGGFKVNGKVNTKVYLPQYDLTTYPDSDDLLIKLYSEGVSLSLSFTMDNDKVEITPTCSEKKINRIWIKFNATREEAIYGCGEQFSELNLRGKNVPLWTGEQGVGRGDPKWLTMYLNNRYSLGGDWYTTYYPQPTFMSSNNYFCHVETSAYAEFNFKKKKFHELFIWDIPEKIVFGKYGNSLLTVGALTEFLGRQPELPEWAYDGVWLGIQGGAEIATEKLNRCLDHGVRATAIWAQDWEGIRMRGKSKRLFWNWIYDKDLYPELPEYIKSLRAEKNVRYLGYVNSFLATDGETYRQASEGGYCIKDKDGNDYHVQTGNGETCLLDLSNPEAVEWLKSFIKEHMIDIGLSGWMADFGEYFPVDCVLHSGEDPELFHNKYPTLWSKLVYEALEESGNLGEIIFFTRSGYSYSSKYTTLVWAGDQLVNWSMDDGLASVIPAALSLGFCGIGYHHSDIGGYTTLYNIKRTPEVFMRWVEQAVFTMVMRSHEGNIPQNNVQFDDEDVLDHFAKMSQVHVHLKPYLIALSKEYQETGIPPMRACFLHYEKDPILHKIKYQYLFGQDLLVAPVIKPNTNKWKVYFPDDDWVHVWSETEFKKGWHDVDAPIGNPPIFYRKSSDHSELFQEIKKI